VYRYTTAEAAFQAALVAKVTATPTEGCFTIDDVKVVSEHFASGGGAGSSRI
jgi:hypothetical protein